MGNQIILEFQNDEYIQHQIISPWNDKFISQMSHSWKHFYETQKTKYYAHLCFLSLTFTDYLFGFVLAYQLGVKIGLLMLKW
jgi:ABC-type nitrate/sulfonate/bicarbonate transport system permease component